MSKVFSLQQQEKLFKEGSATQVKSIINGMQGYVYLTSNRVVFCSRGWFFNSLLGQILQLFSKPRGVDFEIPLTHLQSVSKDSHGFSVKYVFKLSENITYALIFTTKSEKWLEAIIAAKEASFPGISSRKIGNFVEFIHE